MQIGLLIVVCVLGVAGVAVTIAWPLKRSPDPFGDVPRLPAGSLERGDCA